MVGSQNKSAGREWGLYMPNTEFAENTEGYLKNKFVDVGKLSEANIKSLESW